MPELFTTNIQFFLIQTKIYNKMLQKIILFVIFIYITCINRGENPSPLVYLVILRQKCIMQNYRNTSHRTYYCKYNIV